MLVVGMRTLSALRWTIWVCVHLCTQYPVRIKKRPCPGGQLWKIKETDHSERYVVVVPRSPRRLLEGMAALRATLFVEEELVLAW